MRCRLRRSSTSSSAPTPILGGPKTLCWATWRCSSELTDHDASRESGYAAIVDGIPELLRQFVFAPGNRWDAPLTGEAWEVPPVPGAGVVRSSRTDEYADGGGTANREVRIDPPAAGGLLGPLAAVRANPPAADGSPSPLAAVRANSPVAGRLARPATGASWNGHPAV